MMETTVSVTSNEMPVETPLPKETTRRRRGNLNLSETDYDCAQEGELDILSSQVENIYHSTGMYSYTNNDWKTHPIERFLDRLSDCNEAPQKYSKAVRRFYREQDAHIQALQRLTLESGNDVEDTSCVRLRRVSSIIIYAVFFINLALLVGKAVASAISGSLSIVSSLLDSCIDLASSGIMWYTSRQMRKRRPYTYPQGRTRFEPVSIIVLSVLMSSLSFQLIIESVKTIVRMARGEQEAPNVTDVTLGLMGVTVFVKLMLWIVCNKFKQSPRVNAILVDQRNDVISNSLSVLFSGLASRLPPLIDKPDLSNLKYIDPVGAILIGVYILYTWYQVGAVQTRNLAGHTADPSFIQKIAFISLNHHSAIEKLDTIRAFHFGAHFLVEVDIVLPMWMPLKEAHDIGEGLQKKLERMEGVERAFVHLDYEVLHHPESEHKIA